MSEVLKDKIDKHRKSLSTKDECAFEMLKSEFEKSLSKNIEKCGREFMFKFDNYGNLGHKLEEYVKEEYGVEALFSCVLGGGYAIVVYF